MKKVFLVYSKGYVKLLQGGTKRNFTSTVLAWVSFKKVKSLHANIFGLYVILLKSLLWGENL